MQKDLEKVREKDRIYRERVDQVREAINKRLQPYLDKLVETPRWRRRNMK